MNKKKLLALSLGAVMCLAFTSCGGTKYEELPDSEALLNDVKSVDENIGRIEAFDEKTDPNENLGRPNQYISKADFEDLRVEQIGDYLCGGTVETFEDEKDCDDRLEYLRSFQDPSMGAFGLNDYIFKYDKVIFRLSYDLTTDEAKAFHEQLDKVMEKYQDISTQESDV